MAFTNCPSNISLNLIILAGGNADINRVNKWKSFLNSEVTLIGIYGSAETTAEVMWANISSDSYGPENQSFIGTPFPTTNLMILNHFCQPAIEGCFGELYVGGLQTAKKYLSGFPDPGFIEFKNGNRPARFYRTGHKAKLLANNKIQIDEKTDSLLNMQEIWLKTTKIEKILRESPFVSDCAITVCHDFYGRDNIIGLIVPFTPPSGFHLEDFKTWLASRLPEHICPFWFCLIDELPPNHAKPSASQETEKTARYSSDHIPKAPIILIGNSIKSASQYKRADLRGHPFYHAPIFIHFYSADKQQTSSFDIHHLAQKCINDILKKHPKGPYIIMGSCQNSIVAHEVALQLQRLGHEISLLVIIDENWNETGPRATETPPILTDLDDSNKEDHSLSLLKAANLIFSKIKSKSRAIYFSLDEIQKRIYTALGKSLPEAIQFRTMENVFYKVCEEYPYTPVPYSGDVLLLYSKNWMKNILPKLHLYYKGKVSKLEVNIGHSDWFNSEQIQMIIQLIEQEQDNYSRSPYPHLGEP